ncbi:DUF664 domain-containing protein [Nocardiopsis dassonvillei]|uniref:Methyltransferase domain-containing protein n=1 Tax=Nocardiopsis dassonvillei (strain ATCC 23218 / DSM 43111 / CIP 107115 / JCM 7437 / KCTC 9190 / NBRC 14626 / NCTC 10488 / NRRL B-5397 / IMRU 509) TaxID=446468 RepID=D7B4V1_NOCDD|nr:DUF664 domain-containing protein [Nocardiopsis dassonvillei]ADH67141.1 protein of unknown function DUF664 [Nocardiopsis dassonvillei subsp. dassonvillei DSM 43111]NKY82384.1 DUF664 domain-containing protein [Nocardiopsis dassonvillei]VEI87112.1 tellurite resistance protein TehB [Nocardiopsis dassonvillei]
METDKNTSPSREFWEPRYRGGDPSTPPPGPNAAFARLAGELALVPPPEPERGADARRALELACGRGGDALWLAGRGWDVTAVDVAEHALAVLAERARRAGVGDRLTTRRHDLALSVPDAGPWDLVYANYFHTPVDIDRDAVLRRVSRSVGGGGLLVVIDHASSAPWSWEQRDDFPAPEELWRSLDLGADWTGLVCERRSRLAHGPDGRSARVSDNVVVARRRTGATPKGSTRTADAPSRRRDQPPPGTGSAEKEVLTGFLAYLRESVLAKLDGAPEQHVRTPGVASGTNLLGLVKHLAHVERALFLGEEVGDWQATFHADTGETTAGVLEGYRAAVAAADRAIADCDDLGGPAHAGRWNGPAPSMRWALVHMIEETGRHAGHLDILRELVDGRTGR